MIGKISKNNLVTLVLVGLLFIVFGASIFKKDKVEIKKMVNVPKMDLVVKSDVSDWTRCCGQDEEAYKLDFLKIDKISFATDKKDLFIRYDLAAKLPEKNKPLPSYNKDLLTGVVFYLDFDVNYFDGNGNKNPGGFETNTDMSFYGKPLKKEDDGRVNVNGKLVSGGPGFNYFVARFPYKEILFGQFGDSIVFKTSSVAVTGKYAAGASRFLFKNQSMSADGTNFEEIKIPMTLKK